MLIEILQKRWTSVPEKNVPTDRPASEPDRADLRADCEHCFALCCVALAFSISADFAINKGAGDPCPNLVRSNFRCGIHSHLRRQGFRGCAVYDCFGAGQKVSQVTFGGRDWRGAHAQPAQQMFDVFRVMQGLHELLWYLTEALTLPAAHLLQGELSLALEKTNRLSQLNPDDLLHLDLASHQRDIDTLLQQTSEVVRAEIRHRKKNLKGADLAQADLRGANLRGANLRGACLIAAHLERADLRGADLLGADFRDADLRGADLTDALFLIQSQLDAAKGNIETRLTPSLAYPTHW
jgi:uncharacterized protein YjbI with pentapeptide repeats